MTQLYKIIKSAILDVSSYVHIGISIDDIEDVLETSLINVKTAIARPISSMLMYEIKTSLNKDEDLSNLMEDILTKLDLLVVDYKEKTFYEN